jgi:hypothetical protein
MHRRPVQPHNASTPFAPAALPQRCNARHHTALRSSCLPHGSCSSAGDAALGISCAALATASTPGACRQQRQTANKHPRQPSQHQRFRARLRRRRSHRSHRCRHQGHHRLQPPSSSSSLPASSAVVSRLTIVTIAHSRSRHRRRSTAAPRQYPKQRRNLLAGHRRLRIVSSQHIDNVDK